MWHVRDIAPFRDWFTALDKQAQDDVVHATLLLRAKGPLLGRPWVDTLKGARHSNMKELRVDSRGRPLRILFAFDPSRSGVLLIGGDKTGDKRFYDRILAVADALYEQYLKETTDAKGKKKT